ncbi:MAG TPA: fatty acid desaturase [Pirellulales bacterium]|nr:fatty acid desaturase [Pirellulales bacterium]
MKNSIQPAVSTASPDGFSVREARDLVRDLFEPSAVVYWTDFLLTITGGWICFAWLRLGTSVAGQVVAYIGCVLLFYRAGSFIHELVHLRRETYKAFHVVWNLLCGIPLLMPSYMYETHVAHHARNHYATPEDGEYLPLVHGRLRGLLVYLGQSLVIPALAVVRFLVLAPLGWLIPSSRRWIHQRASSLVMDPSYVRPLPSARETRIWRIQEVCCFLIVAYMAGRFFTGLMPWSALLKLYLLAVGVLLLNELRTMGAHRFRFDGTREVTFLEQLLDSVNYPYRPWLTELWAPVGLRFHALHHLFPSMPYHRLPAAHYRLMAQLPADSPYRQTVSTGLWATLGELVREIRVRTAAGRHEAAPLDGAAQRPLPHESPVGS